MPRSMPTALKPVASILLILLIYGCASTGASNSSSATGEESDYCWCESADQPTAFPQCMAHNSCSGPFGRGYCTYACTPGESAK